MTLLRLVLAIHMLDDGITKLGTLQDGSAVHQAFEVVGDGLGCHCAAHTLQDQVSNFAPSPCSGTSSRRRG